MKTQKEVEDSELKNTLEPENTFPMRHFAYPNVRSGEFIGCGRYVALLPEEVPVGQGYEPAAPKVVKLSSTVYMAASLLAPESATSKKKIYEIKDIPLEKYFGPSQNLAYLLSLIRRSRRLIPKGIQGDVWCTGRIYVVEGNRVVLDAVEEVDEKVKAFLADENSDNLFIIPDPNVQAIPDELLQRKPLRVVSLNEFKKFRLKGKTLLKVCPYELEDLRDILFEKLSTDSEIALSSIVTTNPYRGLLAFQEQDAKFFFGRKKDTEQLVGIVHDYPFVIVTGSSGSGKSSLVHAGLIPHLRRQDNNWLITSCRPGKHPFYALSSAIISLLTPNIDASDRLERIKTLTERFRSKELSFKEIFEDLHYEKPDVHLLLVIDQFEELYTLCSEENERQHFIDELFVAFDDQNKESFVILLLIIRADFLGKIFSSRSFTDVFHQANLILGPMTDIELKEAIEEPAAKLNITFEDGLPERILHDVSRKAGVLPLLEFTLTKLWEKQRNRTLTHAGYNEIGRVEESIVSYAESVYEHLSLKEQKQLQHIFTQLVYPGEGTEDTRRIATLQDIGEKNWDLVIKLANARLVVTGSSDTNNEISTTGVSEQKTVEIVHEALIQKWSRLQNWIAIDRDFRRWQEILRVFLQQWKRSDYDQEALLQGKFLEEAVYWWRKKQERLSFEENEFIKISLQFKRKSGQQRKLLKVLLAVSLWLLMLVLILLPNRGRFISSVFTAQPSEVNRPDSTETPMPTPPIHATPTLQIQATEDNTNSTLKKRIEDEIKRQKAIEEEQYHPDWLQSSVRPAHVADYFDWLKGYIERRGKPTSLGNSFESRDFYIATKDFTMTPLYGASSIRLIIPSGINVTINNPGHCTIYDMNGFSSQGIDGIPVYKEIQDKVEKLSPEITKELQRQQQEREQQELEEKKREQEWLNSLRIAHIVDYSEWLKGYIERGGKPTEFITHSFFNINSDKFYVATKDTEVVEIFGERIHVIVPEGIHLTYKPFFHFNTLYYMEGFAYIGDGGVPIYEDMIDLVGESAANVIRKFIQNQKAQEEERRQKEERDRQWLNTLRPALVTDYTNWLKGYIEHGGKIIKIVSHSFPTNQFFVATRDIIVTTQHSDDVNVIVPVGINVTIKELGWNTHIYYMEGFVHRGDNAIPIYSDILRELGINPADFQ